MYNGYNILIIKLAETLHQNVGNFQLQDISKKNML